MLQTDNLYADIGEMNRRTFSVEKKSFSVECAKDYVEIGERGKAVQISVGVELPLVKWLIRKLKFLLESDRRLGHVGSQKGIKMDLTLTVKQNKGGKFLSLLCFSDCFNNGVKCLYIPHGRDSVGWKCFLSALQWVLNIKPGIQTVEIRRRQAARRWLSGVRNGW